jgi:hypothetical protein
MVAFAEEVRLKVRPPAACALPSECAKLHRIRIVEGGMHRMAMSSDLASALPGDLCIQAIAKEYLGR